MRYNTYIPNTFLNTFRIIEDLGMQQTENSKFRLHWGIFECPVCKRIFKSNVALIRRKELRTCGCTRYELVSIKNTKHGLRTSVLYRTWANIIQRCTNPNNKDYEYYGGKGISICDEWRNNFKSFHDWCYNNGYKKGLEIDRENNDLNYDPENCRFVTHNINCQNKRIIISSNKSGYTGVCFHKRDLLYETYIDYNGKRYYIGNFENIIDAVISRNNYILENNLPVHLNIIPENLEIGKQLMIFESH